MQRDAQAIVVDVPQQLEQEFSLHPRVDEDERHAVPLDQRIDFLDRMFRRMAGPWQTLLAVEDRDDRRGCDGLFREHQIGEIVCTSGVRPLLDEPGAQIVRLPHRRRKPGRQQLGRELAQSREIQRQQVASLAGRQRMQFVEDDTLEAVEIGFGILRRHHQRHLLRRGQQDVRRLAALAVAFRDRCIARARLDADRQAHLGNRLFQVAFDIDGERLQRRDVKRMDAGRADVVTLRPVRQFNERRQETRQRLAGARRRDQQRRPTLVVLVDQRELMRPRRPALGGEPVPKARRQQISRHGRLPPGSTQQPDYRQAFPGPAWSRRATASRQPARHAEPYRADKPRCDDSADLRRA